MSINKPDIDKLVTKYITRESHKGAVNRVRHQLAEDIRHIERVAEQRPVGDALEIKVAKETMQAVMGRIKIKDETVADRLLEPLWRVQAWRDGTADKYDLEICIWKLKLLAHLTRRFNWAVFLLKPDNLSNVYTKAQRAEMEKNDGKVR